MLGDISQAIFNILGPTPSRPVDPYIRTQFLEDFQAPNHFDISVADKMD